MVRIDSPVIVSRIYPARCRNQRQRRTAAVAVTPRWAITPSVVKHAGDAKASEPSTMSAQGHHLGYWWHAQCGAWPPAIVTVQRALRLSISSVAYVSEIERLARIHAECTQNRPTTGGLGPPRFQFLFGQPLPPL